MFELQSRNVPFTRGETALLFVDLQRQFLIPGLDPHHPELGPDHYFYRRIREIVLPNAARLMRSSRAAKVEVMYTIIESLTKDGRDRSLDHKLSDIHLPKGHPDARVVDEIAPEEDDIVLPKTFRRLQFDKYRLRSAEPRRSCAHRIWLRHGPVRRYGGPRRGRQRLSCHARGRRLRNNERRAARCGSAGVRRLCAASTTPPTFWRGWRRCNDEPAWTELVPIATSDLCAITRGRSVAAAKLERIATQGVGWVPANSSLTPFDLIADPNPWGSRGDLRADS